jgi:8-oxo-dGTP pyrophosphatase MutT (NUDIX family)
MEITLDLKNYSSKNTIFKRTAARAIITEGDKYLLIFSKYGDYKFPGGGLEKGEQIQETLLREVQEETGYHVVMDSVKKYGKVFERRKGEYDDILEMESHYFFCEVESKVGSRNLDEYEEEYNYQIVWITLPEAIEKNKQVTDLNTCPWVIRDTKVMEFLIS